MAIKGMTIRKTLYKERAREISNFIWSLNLKKPIRVDVAVYDDAAQMEAYVSRIRYAIKVNPDVSLEEIKVFLLQKGYIID